MDFAVRAGVVLGADGVGGSREVLPGAGAEDFCSEGDRIGRAHGEHGPVDEGAHAGGIEAGGSGVCSRGLSENFLCGVERGYGEEHAGGLKE